MFLLKDVRTAVDEDGYGIGHAGNTFAEIAFLDEEKNAMRYVCIAKMDEYDRIWVSETSIMLSPLYLSTDGFDFAADHSLADLEAVDGEEEPEEIREYEYYGPIKFCKAVMNIAFASGFKSHEDEIDLVYRYPDSDLNDIEELVKYGDDFDGYENGKKK